MGKGYQTYLLSFNRRMVAASASVTRAKNAIHSFAEVDVSVPREKIRRHFEETGEKLSFTAYIVACLAEVMKEFPQFNSFIKGRRLIVMEDLTISVLVEREMDGEKVPEPIGIQKAQEKTYRQIHEEIRAVRKEGEQMGSLSGMTWVRFIPNFLLKTFVRLADRNPSLAKKYGKVAVTAVGMFSKEPLWFIPHGSATVLLTVGSISPKVIEEQGRFISKEHLSITATFDHDIVDGAPAARFMSRLCQELKGKEKDIIT